MKNRLQNRFSRVDIAAFLVFAAILAYHILTVRYGFPTADESTFLSWAQRILNGDRLLVDEWSIGQLSGVPLVLPYTLYVTITGGTDGIILFMRYLFLVFNAWIYWEMYVRLREYKWSTLIATALFCICVPFLIFSVNYNSASARLLMIVCLILFKDNPSRPSVIFAGILLSFAVINQPGFALLYVGFTALVWVRFFRQRKGKRFLEDFSFCLNVRTWKYITFAALMCAAVFLSWLFVHSGMRNILQSIPYLLFTDPEYDYSAGGAAWGIFFRKIARAAQIYNPACLIAALAIVTLSIVYARGKMHAHRESVRKILFCLACAVWIFSCVQEFRIMERATPDSFFSLYPAPLFWLGFVCYLLCEQKNRRFLFFWVVGLCASLCIDFISDNALALCCPISYIADLIFFTDLVRELRAQALAKKSADTRHIRVIKQAKRKALVVRWCARLTCLCFAAWFAFVVWFSNPAFPEHFVFDTPLFSLPHVCTQGPWRSLHVSPVIGEDYERQLADIDVIRQKQPESLYVCGLAPELYLHADLPYASCSPWTWRRTEFLDRHVLLVAASGASSGMYLYPRRSHQ